MSQCVCVGMWMKVWDVQKQSIFIKCGNSMKRRGRVAWDGLCMFRGEWLMHWCERLS